MVEPFIQAKNNPILKNICNLFLWIFNNKLISFFLFLILFKIFSYLFDNRPIKFERYKTANALKEFLEANYPIGSNANIVFEALKKSGAKCQWRTSKTTKINYLKKYNYIGSCYYYPGLFNFMPLKVYRILILGNKNLEIIEFSILIFNDHI